jgi:hypothetical protein
MEGMATTNDPAPESDRADYVQRLIAARIPELGLADLATLGAAPDSDALPGSIGLQILEVVEALADRMDGLERAVRPA